MPIRQSRRRIAVARMAAIARDLLEASPLCAIATVGPDGEAHVNTGYFAWNAELDIVWLSEPDAKHSRNIRTNETVAIAVYDSKQSWGTPDRGIQLFGTAGELEGRAQLDAATLYRTRFPDYGHVDLSAPYRFYRFQADRVKLFDERALGTAVFVTARVRAPGKLAWEQTEVYSLGSK